MSLHLMNPESRMWFYGLKQPLDASRSEALVQMMDAFVGEWKAHGADLQAGYRLIGNQCLIIAVDESMQAATGCSIDKSVHLLQDFGAQHGVDFFNRMLIFTFENGQIAALSPQELKEAIAQGKVNADTQVLHALAPTLKESGQGLIPLKDSWAAKYL